MPISQTDQENQDKLKRELQSESKATKLENLAAALVGKLLGVSISVAKSGFQHGGDAGPAGRQGRRFRLECKKYSDTTPLSDRELLGEIDQALSRDPALEAWLLVSTREVPEQLEQALHLKGEREGVPVAILDWKSGELASLAALCAFDPDTVEAIFSKDAGNYARALKPVSSHAIEMLQRDLQSWSLGFETLRKISHEKIQRLWSSPHSSQVELGQNAAGGAQAKKIKRTSAHQSLNNWWTGVATAGAPAAVIGWEGVGKTWATLDWLMDSLDEQPVVLAIPSSSAATLSGVSEAKIKQFLSERLYELSGVRDIAHWLRRLDHLLKRPSSEGPVLTIFFDGLNQEPSVLWVQLLKIMQSEAFSSKVRVIVSTRKHHFEDKLSNLRGLITPAHIIEVDIYDTAPGGELEQMLVLEGLNRKDLHPDLVELARTPRLFTLVVKFRDRLVEAGQITVHRLLWEYGRDTLGIRAGLSFSESEWQDWLKEIAQRYRDGSKRCSIKSLSESTSRPDLDEKEVYARLSDIIDGRFVIHDPAGGFSFSPTVIAHSLGVALLAHLDATSPMDFPALDTSLAQWLDPIAGLDQRAEILRAAVSILIEQQAKSHLIAGLLVTAWLQTQNVTDSHRKELAALAPELTDALLTAIEYSESHTHASARLWAVNALRAIPRDNQAAAIEIFSRIAHWLSVVSRDVSPPHMADENSEKRRSERFMRRIGTDTPGKFVAVGVKLELVDQYQGTLQIAVPSIMEGFPLALALPAFTAAAATLAVRDRCEGWDGLKWLCLLNEVDPDETSTALRRLSASIRLRKSEPGIHPDLPARIAALLLWLTGQEKDEEAAATIDPRIDHWYSYENDYLPNLGRSLFALERRHAEMALNDTEIPLFGRTQRTKELWLDPDFQPPASFVAEVRELANHIDVGKLNRSGFSTIEDHNFEELERVFARCAPDLLGNMMRKKLQGAATCPPESRYWCGINTVDHFLLTGSDEAAAAKRLRQNYTDPDKKQESFVANRLLMLELRDLDVRMQLNTIIAANIEYILTDFAEVLRTPSAEDADVLISNYASGTAKQNDDLLILLSIHTIEFSETAWSWIADYARQPDHKLSRLAFRTLALSNATRLGKMLMADDWHWSADKDDWVNHYGTGALIQVSQAIPFEQITPRLAPWRLLEAARLRGNDPAEVRLAAEIVWHLLSAQNISAPDPGAELTFDRGDAKSFPFCFSASPRKSDEDNDPLAAFKAHMDVEARLKAHQEASDIALSRIQEARQAGAKLYLAELDVTDFESVIRHAPDIIDVWLDGFKERTADFRRRVHLSENAFLSLCEALFTLAPDRGVELWRALRGIVSIRYLGEAGIEDLLLMIFRAPDSLAVNKLREGQLDPMHSNTDQALFDLALAAALNGKSDWLDAAIESDRNSEFAWKRKRGEVLSGFTANNMLPITEAWPDGEITTPHASLKMRSARFKWIEACAHHWWKTYLDADTPDEAYAAWILFLKSADQRAKTWMHREISLVDHSNRFLQLKLSHVRLNRNELKRAMEKRVEKLDKELFDRDICVGVGPWGKETH
ncbi:MAG: hypothetical protein WA056_02105 [Gallionella sp.]